MESIEMLNVATGERHRQTIATTTDWQATPPTVTITVTDDATGDVVSETTQEVPLPEVEQHAYATELAAMLVELIAAQDALTNTLPNNAFTGARELKTWVRSVRRALRAVNRDLKQIDTGA